VSASPQPKGGFAAGIADRHLYLCTPDRPDLDHFLAAVIHGGVDIVQLRDKELDDDGIRRASAVAQARCAAEGVPFILNDRPDLAHEIGSDGVHVGQDDLKASQARRLLGDAAIIGLSTHASGELALALQEDVTYISAGPIEATPTKPGRPGTGIGYAQEAVALAQLPVFITGGVRPEGIPALVEAGLSHFVVVRYLTEATDPAAAARALSSAIAKALA